MRQRRHSDSLVSFLKDFPLFVRDLRIGWIAP